MDNLGKLKVLIDEKSSTEYDLQRNKYEVEFLNSIEELPEYLVRSLEQYIREIDTLTKKIVFLDLKIEELNAIISNTQ